MTENNISDPETDNSCTEEEVEPKLKYVRLSNDLKSILNKDAVTCIAVHPKFLCLGTYFGAVHLLDHLGNTVTLNKKQNLPNHVVAVNQISVDSKGEFLATCSDDGMVKISGFYTEENNQNLNIGQNVKSIALDPLFYKSGSGRKCIVGDSNLTLYEKTFLKGMKTTLLSYSEGSVSSIAWCGQWVAWASGLGVRVYDLNEKNSLGLIKWEEPKGSILSDYRCNLKWSNPTTLLIGWVDTIRICIIRKRNAIEASTRNMPGYIVDPISTFQTDFFICGLAPLDEANLVVLGYPKEKDAETKKALRPILSVLKFKASDYVEICTDSLSIRGYHEYKCNDYHLDCLIEENQYFIVSPKDIVVASQYETDDRVKWLLQHEKFENAMEVISANGGSYSMIYVAKQYLDYLLSLSRYDEAAKLCLRAFGNDKLLWEEEVYKFVKSQQLRSVSAFLPRTNEHKLGPHVYEMVLFEYLKLDAPGFLNLIKEWQPTLYNTTAVINAILDHFNENDKNILLESLAILYSHEKKYDKALTMYLKLQHKDVFDLIRKHDLYCEIHLMIVQLIQLDNEKAIALLLEKKKIPPKIVVEKLDKEKNQEYLYMYLDALDKVDSSGDFDDKLVKLYSKYSPIKLLPFLKRSNRYDISEALEICKKSLYFPEMVYLLGRMGNTKEALSIIIQNIKDIQIAIEFCKENDDKDLWNDLIEESLNKPHIMTKLLDGIVGFIDPEILVKQIQIGQDIPGLKNSLIKMLCDYSLQVSIQEDCSKILVTDYFNLHDKLSRTQQKAISISHKNSCELCGREIIIKERFEADLIVFNCRHYFHDKCLPKTVDFCIVCKSKKK